jgi:hypothetical protein
MEWRTIISPQLSAALGGCGLSRDALILALSALHHTLPEQAERWRRTRAPDEPDSFFCFGSGSPTATRGIASRSGWTT